MPTTRKIKVGSLTFNCLFSGHPSNPLVILLHGFPESSHMWIKLMDELADQGFYCIAPDLRGYSPEACPEGTKNYKLDLLAKDVIDIATSAKDKFHLIAHDWGAGIGWVVAHEYPETILSFAALSVPHNSAFGKAFRIDKVQKKMSQYMLWILIPSIPEWLIRRNDFARFRELWADLSESEIQHNLSIFKRRKSLTAALNYYRANIGKGKGKKIGKITVPVLFIWGNKDFAVSRSAAEFNHSYMSGPYEYLEVDGGHWLMQTNYSEVSKAILTQLTKHN